MLLVSSMSISIFCHGALISCVAKLVHNFISKLVVIIACVGTTGVWSSFLVTQFFSDSFMGNAAWGQEKDRMGNKKLIYVYLLFLMLLLDLYRDSEKQVLAENGSSMLFTVPIYASESVSTSSTCSYAFLRWWNAISKLWTRLNLIPSVYISYPEIVTCANFECS